METLPLAVPREVEANKTNDAFFDTEHIKADLGRRTVRGGAVTVGYQVGKQLINIVATAIMARLILPADSGLVNMVVIVTGFIALFNDLGLSAATIQHNKLEQPQVSSLFWINVAMGSALALVTAATAPFLAWFYNEPRLIAVTMVIATGFAFGGLTVQHRALMKRQMRFTALVSLDLTMTLVGTLVAIVSAFLLPENIRYWALVFEMIAQSPIEIIGLWLLCRWRPDRPAIAKGLRSMLAFGGNLTGFRIVNYFARNMDNLLIGKFYGPASLGLYAKAYGLLLLPLRRVNEPFAAVAMPALSRLQDSPERYRQTYNRMSSGLCLLTVPLIAYMIGAADWIIITVLSDRWAAAATLFALLGISGLSEQISNSTGWLFTSQGRTREQFHWGMVSTGLTLGAIILGLFWGPVGVATSYGLVGLFIRTPLLFWYVGRRGPITTGDLYRSLAPFAATAVAILLALYAFRLWGATGSPLLNSILGAGITGVVSLAVLAILPAGREALLDLKKLPSMLLKRKK